MSRSALVVLLALLVVGAPACGGDDDDDTRARPGAASAQPPPPPDGGTRAGHGADVSPTVEVPESDESPPKATITLSAGGAPLGRASEPGGGGESLVRLRRLSLRGTTVGRDPDGGVARVRVSIMERIACRRAGSDATFTRLRRRYFPPPQVERIRSTPGTVLPTRRVRSLELRLGGRRCGAEARPRVIHGELWGEAVNGSGLEAVTPHVRFRAAAG